MGDLRNKRAKEARDESHRQRLARQSRGKGSPPSPPLCGCGAPAAFMAHGRWDTFPYCPSCLPADPFVTPARETAVCNLYSMTSTRDAIRQLARTLRDLTGNLQPLPAIFPDGVAPVVRTAPDGVREAVMMRWGFPQPSPRQGGKPRSGYVTNVRNTRGGWWKPWLGHEHRCLVPVTSFCEPDWRSGKHVPTWFARDPSRPLFFFAGVWRPWSGHRGTKANSVDGDHLLFSFLTTEPNSIIAPIHEKAMPVLLLDEAEREKWLTAPMDEALQLQRPAPNDAVQIVATGAKQDAG